MGIQDWKEKSSHLLYLLQHNVGGLEGREQVRRIGVAEAFRALMRKLEVFPPLLVTILELLTFCGKLLHDII